ncbi:hypothetical protein JCM11251_001981 [Rhodosporidiobolus azoricus]
MASPATPTPPQASSDASGGESSASSSTSGETAKDTSIMTYAAVASSSVPPASPSADDLGTTPTARSGTHLTTPPSQARSVAGPAKVLSAAASPAPTSSPTPNPHRRTHSATSSGPPSAPISAVSSPARREFTPGDISDAILHEESGEEEEDAAPPTARPDELFNTASTSSGSRLERRSSTRGGSSLLTAPGQGVARSRPPSSAHPSQTGSNYRRSISVNTAVSTSSTGAPAPAPSQSQQQQQAAQRRSLYHPVSQAALSSAPSHSSSRARPSFGSTATGTSHDIHRRSASRTHRPPASATASDEDGEDEDWPPYEDVHVNLGGKGGRGRAFSPAPVQQQGDEDDEVRTRDRGEELVRKRMRERKEARRAARAASRQQQQQEQQRLSSYTSYSLTPSHEGLENTLGLGYPHPGVSTSRTRDASVARSEAFSAFSDGARSPTHAHFQQNSTPWSPLPLPPHAYSAAQGYGHSTAPPTPGLGPVRPGLGSRGASYVSNASSFPSNAPSHSGSTAPSVIEGSEAGDLETGAEETEEERDYLAREREDGVGEIMGRGEPRLEDWRDGGADGTHAGNSDEDSEEGDDVEYTLKDRQDAINVEHPFGLPIWKPALYKKSRSIARHAESALHSAPSSTALHHLLPVNLLWTLVFGFALFAFCTLVSGVLWITPWGGGKYGRVVWELGTYLFWPFGKYVEGWTDGGQYDDDETEAANENDEEQAHHPAAEGTYRHDPEAGGRTFAGRGRSGTISASASAAGTTRVRPSAADVFQQDQGALPDEPLRRSDRTVRATPSTSSLRPPTGQATEQSALLADRRAHRGYGSSSTVTSGGDRDKSNRSSGSEETITGHLAHGGGIRPHDFSKDSDSPHPFRLRALGRVMYWATFYGLIAPVLAFTCLLCWFFVFTIPMAKLLWVLLRHLNNEPLSLHFRSPREYAHVEQDLSSMVDEDDLAEDGEEGAAQHDGEAIGTRASSGSTLVGGAAHHEDSQHGGVHGDHPPHGSNIVYPLRAGQPAPPVSRKRIVADKQKGRLRGPHPTVLLCTYRAAGLEYYKYTLDGVNIWFVNLMSLVFFAIADFFILEPYVHKHPDASAFLKLISGQAFVFILSLLAVIPLSYFIGMAVASISAQSSIGMGAVINASFGSVIEIILYSIALTQAKGELVEGSIVGSILAGVLLMPGMSMIGGAVRRKEQRFNAKSAGVTSTMLIMAVIGTLTPTMFYEIYGSFQLTCTGCDLSGGTTNGGEQCRSCYYEHVSPVDDPFYKSTVKYLSYYCAIILVLSYLIGLWFSLRTHASQIWQNAAPTAAEHGAARPLSGASHPTLHDRRSIYQRIVPSQLFQPRRQPSGIVSGERAHAPLATPLITPVAQLPPGPLPPHVHHGTDGGKHDSVAALNLPQGMTVDEFSRAIEVVSQLRPQGSAAALHRAPSHVRDISAQAGQVQHKEEDGGHGGHDAPNWSRAKSATVLLACTVLYAIIAEILVDVVDVVLDGSGIPEKLLGVTLFALVPNTTEFMNAISFALNGNIALSMEIGSAYALQVCLIQAPAMLAFSAWYGRGQATMLHRAFTLIFPRWDVIAILFSIFLLTYVYIESRSNYQRGALLCLSYLVLIGGFAFAPGDRDTSDNPNFDGGPSFASIASSTLLHPASISGFGKIKAIFLALFTR